MRNPSFQRLRPSPTLLVALIGLLWAFSFGAVREFIWADVRKGMIHLDGLSRVTRGLVVLGFGLLFLMVGALLFTDVWRAQFELLPLETRSTTIGRGSLLPILLAPATLFLFSVAWAFALAGALHSHWAIRLAIVALYLLAALGWSSRLGTLDLGPGTLSWGALAGVPCFFLIRWWAVPRPSIEFAVLLPLVGVTLALLQSQGVDTWRLSGLPNFLLDLSGSVQSLSTLAFPLLVRLGLNIADFTQRAAGWTVSLAADRLPKCAPPTVLALLLGWRLWEVAQEAVVRVRDSSVEAEALPFLGAFVVPLSVGLVWWLVIGRRAKPRPGSATVAADDRPPSVDDVAATATKHSMLLIVAWFGLSLLTFVVLDTSRAMIGVLGPEGVQAAGSLVALADVLRSRPVDLGWRLAVDGAAATLAIVLTMRGHQAPALYLGIFALLDARQALIQPGSLLSHFYPVGSGNPVEFWWVILFALFAAVWLVHGRLTPARVGRLLFLLLATALLRQTDFISNPFSPFIGFAGVWFIAFGLVWDALTIGSWANATSPALPRVSRIFLYLGYVIFTVTIVNWAFTVHDLSAAEWFTGWLALGGLRIFGLPMLYAVFAVTLALPAEGEDATDAPYWTRRAEEPRPVPVAYDVPAMSGQISAVSAQPPHAPRPAES